MADYISKNEVLNLIMHNDKVCHYADERYENVVYATACRISDVVANMPAADVQPVKRGKWCPPLMGQGKFATYCSMCQYTIMRNATGIFEETPFCPHCGADMRGDTNE